MSSPIATSLPEVEREPAGVESSFVPSDCDAQAARVVQAGWFESIHRPRAKVLRWRGHYSPKYDHCYVLVDHLVPLESDAAVVVSELWDAFEADALARCTDEARARVSDAFCQVALSDDPFTSCGVCRNFIDQHMEH